MKINNYFMSKTVSILEAMKRLDENEIKVIFVVENKKLIATVTDGDIRRGILNGKRLDTNILECANFQPVYVYEKDRLKCKKMMQDYDIEAVPVLNRKNEIDEIVFRKERNETFVKCGEKIPVVMMAGGLGTRLYPYTKILPKALIPIEDTPISERIIESFRRYGCQEFFMIVNHKKNMIKAYFNDIEKKYNLKFIEEDEPLGTGGGLQLLAKTVRNTFILTNCDILIMDNIEEILLHHKKNKNSVTMVCSLKNYQIPYGVVNFSDGGAIDSFEEKPEMSFFTNTGYYILEPDIFDYINKNEKIGMPDIIMRMKESNLKVGIYPIGENSWLDMGQMDTMEQMEQRIRDIT